MELAVNYDIKQITFHHILSDDKTLCGRKVNYGRRITHLNQGWYIQEGSIEEVSCKVCKDIYSKNNNIPVEKRVMQKIAGTDINAKQDENLHKQLKTLLRSYGHRYHKTVVFHKDNGQIEYWLDKIDDETIAYLSNFIV